MSVLRRDAPSLALPISFSAVLHVAAAAWVLTTYTGRAPSLPPMYKVNLVAAPPGERAAGVVSEAPAPAVPTPAPPAADRLKAPPAKALPKKATRTKQIPKLATPAPPRAASSKSAAPPKAGGGPEGGAGADVANVKTAGIDFPFPAYLQNVVRQIALNFTPPSGTGSLRAEVMFVIRRDGSVTSVRILTNSGSYVFDVACRGAIEAAARAQTFGALPAGFADDALPVIFSFDPKRMK